MKEITYICDRCKKSSKSNDELQLKNIKILQEGDYSRTPTGEVDWCLQCRIDTGFQGIWERGEKQTPKSPLTHGEALEEILKELIQAEMSGGN